jgi:kynurenine formamidase
VRTGEVFSLNWNVELPDPSPFRQLPVRHQVGAGGFGRDDWLDRFYLQGSSQWDGLRHIAHPRHGFLQRRRRRARRRSRERHARHPGRRATRHRRTRRAARRRRARGGRGRPFAANEPFAIDADLLDRVAAAEDVTIHTGDVLLVRTGWTGWYVSLSADARRDVGPATPEPGLESVERTAEWLWDHHVAPSPPTTSRSSACRSTSAKGHSLHFWLLPCFGMPIGELWWLDDLAAACARDRRWTFQLVSAPLNVRGGVGSPPNALAIR